MVRAAVGILLALFVTSGFAQSQGYTISTYAGGALLPLPVAALQTPIGNAAGIAVDASSNIYFSTGGSSNNYVLKIDSTGTLTAVAGSGRVGYIGDGGPATSAQLANPQGLAIDAAGNLYIADSWNSEVRRVTPDGTISTFAGNGWEGYSGDGGPATAAELDTPADLAFDLAGNLYISDSRSNVIRKVDPTGVITTIAGGGNSGLGDGGPATQAQLGAPRGIAVDSSGNIYFADSDRIRKITTDGLISTIAGTEPNGVFPGDGGPAVNAQIFPSGGVAVDASGAVYFVDGSSIRMIATDGTLSTFDGGLFGTFNGLIGMLLQADGSFVVTEASSSGISHVVQVSPAAATTILAGNGSALIQGDGGSATQAQLAAPYALAVDAPGNLYIADWNSGLIRQVSPDGIISTLSWPLWAGPILAQGLAVDSSGNLYFGDADSSTVWKVSPNGTLTPFAGGRHSSLGDGGPALGAGFIFPAGLAVDASGNLYIADSGANRVRKVDPTGIITTVAGNGVYGHSGDGGLATDASLWYPSSVAVDTTGNLYIVENGAGYVRKVTPEGIISTFAGSGELCGCNPLGDGGPPAAATIDPMGVAVDPAGNVYITDGGNSRVRMVTADGTITTIAGSDNYGYSGDGGPAVGGAMWWPYSIVLDPAGRIFVGDVDEGAVRLLTPAAAHPALDVYHSNAGH